MVVCVLYMLVARIYVFKHTFIFVVIVLLASPAAFTSSVYNLCFSRTFPSHPSPFSRHHQRLFADHRAPNIFAPPTVHIRFLVQASACSHVCLHTLSASPGDNNVGSSCKSEGGRCVQRVIAFKGGKVDFLAAVDVVDVAWCCWL